MNSHRTRSQRNDWQLGFIDLLLTMVGLFAALFIVTLLQVRPDAAAKNVEMKAEYIITMTWPDKSFDDIDIHVKLPDDRIVNFARHDAPYATLDRDDTGVKSDVYTENGTQKLLEINREIVTIRAIVPGTYVVNVHVFRINNTWPINGQSVESQTKLPYVAKLTLQRLNPRVEELTTIEIPLDQVGQQKTAFSFDVEPDGKITNINKLADVPFVRTLPAISLDDPMGGFPNDR